MRPYRQAAGTARSAATILTPEPAVQPLTHRLATVVSAVAALLVVAPHAGAQVLVIGQQVQERDAAPGQRYDGRITVRNVGNRPTTARVYQTDYMHFADGRSTYDAPGGHARSNARWVAVSPTPLSLMPGEEVAIPYTVTVPRDAGSLAGSYWSVIMVQDAPADTTADPARAKQFGLRSAVRSAIQIVTHVPGTGQAKFTFDSLGVTRDAQGHRQLQLDVVQAGTRAQRPLVSVEVYSSDGRLVARREQQRGLLLPGFSVRQTFDIGALPAGTYRALVVADAGGDEMFGSQFTLHL